MRIPALPPHCLRQLVAGSMVMLAPVAPAAELVLFDFTRPYYTTQVRPLDAQVAGTNSALCVVTGREQSRAGVILSAPAGRWDLSRFGQVTLAVKNTGTNKLSLACRADNPEAEGQRRSVSGSVSLGPQEAGTLRVELKRSTGDTMSGKLFGMRGYPVGEGGPGTLDPANVSQLMVFVNQPKTAHVFELRQVRAEGGYTAPTASTRDADPFFAFINTFGQYRHQDWPGKTHSVEQMAERRAAEAKVMAANPGPPDWDRYGGWAKGPRLKASGFFRTEKYRGKWWLVDPDGRLFFSHGIDCVRMLDVTPISERAAWFEAFPGDTSELEEFVVTRAFALKGHYAGQTPKCYSFAGANLKRKYGPDWRQRCPEVIQQRLRHWGLNTIGMWSDESIRLRRQTPYVDAVSSSGGKLIEGSEGYWGKFPDVFDPSFEERVRRSAEAKRDNSAGDPWCLGYFADNEIAWGDEVSLALAALRSPPEQAAKLAFIADLKAKYGSIEKLNAAWGTQHVSWEALLAERTSPNPQKARRDLLEFYTRTAEQYFRTIRDALKAVAPHQLYLGCRFAWGNASAAAAAAKYCDVVSYNLYRRSIADFQFNGGADVPLIVGEFHFGALDRGMFHTGLVPVQNQAERASLYREYVRGALRHPQFVGCHWFQYQDEPTTGRVYDEENYQIGFVDIADTPYAETIGASQDIGKNLYRYRLE